MYGRRWLSGMVVPMMAREGSVGLKLELVEYLNEKIQISPSSRFDLFFASALKRLQKNFCRVSMAEYQVLFSDFSETNKYLIFVRLEVRYPATFTLRVVFQPTQPVCDLTKKSIFLCRISYLRHSKEK